ncbi:uncharacterized protein LOC120199359 [Hibiscus syriacus]|uniref:uncharacterized protein LOC120199359 n=1 Tax=Hibiscus syriacus TaxID=106335 RepID=UPI0019244E8F|nr:uncharacterized protein LOC120199359 [Hibiscus syriacus]
MASSFSYHDVILFLLSLNGLSCDIVELFPREVLSKILVHVVSNSIVDFLNTRLSYKTFNEVSKHNYIFESVSLKNINIAVDKDNIKVIYVYVIILIYSGGELRDEGLQIVKTLDLTNLKKINLDVIRSKINVMHCSPTCAV